MSNQPTASTIRIYGQHDSFSKQDWQLMKGEVNGILSCEYPPQMMLFARNTNNFSMIRATAAVRGFSPDGSQLAPCADPENVIFGLFGTNGGPNAWIKAVSASDKSKTMGILTSIAPHPPSSYPINKSTRQVNGTNGNSGDPGEFCKSVDQLPQPRDDITPIDIPILNIISTDHDQPLPPKQLEGWELHREEELCADVYLLGKTVHLTHCQGSLENAQVVHCKIDYHFVFTGDLNIYEKPTQDPTIKELWVHVDGRSFAKSYTWDHKLFDIKTQGSLGAGVGVGTGGLVGLGNLTVGESAGGTGTSLPNGIQNAAEGTVATT
ncbi:MAG: hypothetical protein OHK93_000787 [Ramalina farinacea]|uniref:Uncharacterized protein n=1 Tax=Ramalina farinacea TaxID=258253 RepID=A0AA43QSI7_9LECA|nr:hypothetical protein [Ramalina farinacea]